MGRKDVESCVVAENDVSLDKVKRIYQIYDGQSKASTSCEVFERYFPKVMSDAGYNCDNSIQ